MHKELPKLGNFCIVLFNQYSGTLFQQTTQHKLLKTTFCKSRREADISLWSSWPLSRHHQGISRPGLRFSSQGLSQSWLHIGNSRACLIVWHLRAAPTRASQILVQPLNPTHLELSVGCAHQAARQSKETTLEHLMRPRVFNRSSVNLSQTYPQGPRTQIIGL